MIAIDALQTLSKANPRKHITIAKTLISINGDSSSLFNHDTSRVKQLRPNPQNYKTTVVVNPVATFSTETTIIDSTNSQNDLNVMPPKQIKQLSPLSRLKVLFKNLKNFLFATKSTSKINTSLPAVEISQPLTLKDIYEEFNKPINLEDDNLITDLRKDIGRLDAFNEDDKQKITTSYNIFKASGVKTEDKDLLTMFVGFQGIYLHQYAALGAGFLPDNSVSQDYFRKHIFHITKDNILMVTTSSPLIISDENDENKITKTLVYQDKFKLERSGDTSKIKINLIDSQLKIEDPKML